MSSAVVNEKARLDAEEAFRCSEKRKNRDLWYEAYKVREAGHTDT